MNDFDRIIQNLIKQIEQLNAIQISHMLHEAMKSALLSIRTLKRPILCSNTQIINALKILETQIKLTKNSDDLINALKLLIELLDKMHCAREIIIFIQLNNQTKRITHDSTFKSTLSRAGLCCLVLKYFNFDLNDQDYTLQVQDQVYKHFYDYEKDDIELKAGILMKVIGL